MSLTEINLDGWVILVDCETAENLKDPLYKAQYVKMLHDTYGTDSDSLPLLETNTLNDSRENHRKASLAEDKKSSLWTSAKAQTDRDKRATLMLLELRKEYDSLFLDKKTAKNDLWIKIANQLNASGFFVGEGVEAREKCRHKFANLQNSYMKYKDKVKKTGEGRVLKPQFYEELDEILGNKHKTEPILVIDSIAGHSTSKSGSSNSSNSNTESAAGPSSSEPGSSDVIIDSKSADQKNRFQVESKKPVKHKILENIYNLEKENMAMKQSQFERMMTFMESQAEKRHGEVMALFRTINLPTKKRRRSSSED